MIDKAIPSLVEKKAYCNQFIIHTLFQRDKNMDTILHAILEEMVFQQQVKFFCGVAKNLTCAQLKGYHNDSFYKLWTFGEIINKTYYTVNFGCNQLGSNSSLQ